MKNICMAERNMINRSRTSIRGPRIRKCQEAYDQKQRRTAHSNSVEPQVLKYSSMIQKKVYCQYFRFQILDFQSYVILCQCLKVHLSLQNFPIHSALSLRLLEQRPCSVEICSWIHPTFLWSRFTCHHYEKDQKKTFICIHITKYVYRNHSSI